MSCIIKRKPSEDRASASPLGGQSSVLRGFSFYNAGHPKIVPRSRKTLLFSWEQKVWFGQEGDGRIFTGKQSNGNLMHFACRIASLFRFSHFAVVFDRVFLHFTRSCGFASGPHRAKINGHMTHFLSSYRLLCLHFAISNLLSFWQASS